MNTSLVYFSHIVFLVQHIGNASEGKKTQCSKKKKNILGFLKEKLNTACITENKTFYTVGTEKAQAEGRYVTDR